MSTSVVEQVKSEYFTKAQAARELRITQVTLWRWIKNGKIEAHRLGREVLIEKQIVERIRDTRNKRHFVTRGVS